MVPTDCAQDSGKKSAHEPLGSSPEDLPTGPAGTPKALSAKATLSPQPPPYSAVDTLCVLLTAVARVFSEKSDQSLWTRNLDLVL